MQQAEHFFLTPQNNPSHSHSGSLQNTNRKQSNKPQLEQYLAPRAKKKLHTSTRSLHEEKKNIHFASKCRHIKLRTRETEESLRNLQIEPHMFSESVNAYNELLFFLAQENKHSDKYVTKSKSEQQYQCFKGLITRSNGHKHVSFALQDELHSFTGKKDIKTRQHLKLLSERYRERSSGYQASHILFNFQSIYLQFFTLWKYFSYIVLWIIRQPLKESNQMF